MTASDFDHAHGFLLTRGRSPYIRRLWDVKVDRNAAPSAAAGRQAATFPELTCDTSDQFAQVGPRIRLELALGRQESYCSQVSKKPFKGFWRLRTATST